jgi:hypothetical protein
VDLPLDLHLVCSPGTSTAVLSLWHSLQLHSAQQIEVVCFDNPHSLEGINDMIYRVNLTILIHHISGEVQINCELVEVSIADAQLVGINVCHTLLTLTPHSPAYIPG